MRLALPTPTAKGMYPPPPQLMYGKGVTDDKVGETHWKVANGINDHDELRSDPMLAVALNKDDVKGEQRRRAQDRGKALAGKSTLNRLELTAPDYDGAPRKPDSNKPETKKIGVDPQSIDALLVDLFVEAHLQAPDRIILDLDATDDILYGNQEGRFYHGYYHDYCYLPLYVF